MKPALYTFINRGLGMSTGKTTAQGQHAACEAMLLSHPKINPQPRLAEGAAQEDLWYAWRRGLHYAKYVMECRDTEHLLTTERYLNERGFKTILIIDEGHTEIDPITVTALGVALVDKDDPHTAATFSSFRLYRDERPQRPSPMQGETKGCLCGKGPPHADDPTHGIALERGTNVRWWHRISTSRHVTNDDGDKHADTTRRDPRNARGT